MYESVSLDDFISYVIVMFGTILSSDLRIKNPFHIICSLACEIINPSNPISSSWLKWLSPLSVTALLSSPASKFSVNLALHHAPTLRGPFLCEGTSHSTIFFQPTRTTFK
jgi:hypothetical protein